MTKDFTKPRTSDDHHRLTNRKTVRTYRNNRQTNRKPIRPVYMTNALTETHLDTQVTHTLRPLEGLTPLKVQKYDDI